MEHSDNKKPPTDDRSSSPDPNSLPRSRKTDEYNQSPYNDHGHSPYLDVIEIVPGVNSKPFLPPETLDIVDGIRPSSSKTRGVSHLPAIEESLYEDREEVGLGESRSASSISSPRLPSLPSSPLPLNSKHSPLNRVSCKPALTSISEEFIPRISDNIHGGQASQNGDAAQASNRKRSRSQCDESKYRILQGFGDVAAVRSRDVTHVRVPDNLIHPALHRNEGLFPKPGLKVRAGGEGYEDTIGNVDTRTSECTEELRMKLLQLDTSHLWGYFDENSEQATQDRCNSHPTLSDTTCDGAGNKEEDGASNSAVDHPEPNPPETVPQGDASYGADGEGNLSQQYYTLGEGSYNEGEGSQQIGRAASMPGEWQEAYLNSGDLGNESMFCRIGEEQVIPIGDIMTTYTTVTTQTCVFKPVCIASLNIYINQIVLGSLCEVIVQLAIKRAFQEIKKKTSTPPKNGFAEEVDGTKTNYTPNSNRPKNSGSDSVIADNALSSGDVSMPRESFSEHTTGSASSERQDKEFKDKESKKQRDKDMVSKQRGRERERNKRKRDREDRGISPGKQKSLRNAVGDIQRVEDEPGAGEKITGVIDFGFRENAKVAPRQSGQAIRGKEVSEITSTGIGQTNVRIIDVTKFVEASESSNRNEDSGDVRDHAMKTTCGLESQTVTSQSDDSSMGDNQTFRGRLRTTDSSETQSEDDKMGEEAPWNVEAIKMSTSRFGKRTSHHRQKQLGGLNTQVNLSTSPVLSENTSLTRASHSESEKDVSDYNDVSRQDIESAPNSSALQEFGAMGPINTADDVTDSTSHDSCLESGLLNRRKESLNSTSFASILVCAVFNESFNHPPKYSAENVQGDWDHSSESQAAPLLESNAVEEGARSGGSLLDLNVSVGNSENTALIDANETFTTVAESAHDDAAKLLSSEGGAGARDGKHIDMHSPTDVVSDWPVDWDVSADTSEYVTAYNQDMPQNDTTGAVNCFQDCSDVMIKDGTLNDEDPFCDNKLEHLTTEHVLALGSLLYNQPIACGGAESGGILDADDIHSCTEREEEIGSILESEHTQCADGLNYLVAESSQHEIDGASILVETKQNGDGVEENTEDLSSLSVCGQQEGKATMPEVKKEQFVHDGADTSRKQEGGSNEFKISEENESTVDGRDDIPGDGIGATPRDTKGDIPRDTKGDIQRNNSGDIPEDNNGGIPRHNSGDIHSDIGGDITGDNTDDIPRDNIGEIPGVPRDDILGLSCVDIPGDVSIDIPRENCVDTPGDNFGHVPQDTRWDSLGDIQCNTIGDIPGDTRGDTPGDDSVDIAPDNIGDIDARDGRGGLDSLELSPEHSGQIQVEKRVKLSSEETEKTALSYDEIDKDEEPKDKIDHAAVQEEVSNDKTDHDVVQEEVPNDNTDPDAVQEEGTNDKIDHDVVQDELPTDIMDYDIAQEELPTDKRDHGPVQEEVPNDKSDDAALQGDLSCDKIDLSDVQDDVSFARIDHIVNSGNEISKDVTIKESCLDNKLQPQSRTHEAISDEAEAIEAAKVPMHKGYQTVVRELSLHVSDDKVTHELQIQEGDEKVVSEVTKQKGDRKMAFEVPIPEDDMKRVFKVPIQECDEKVTFDVTIPEEDKTGAFEVLMQEGDEKVAFEVPAQEGDDENVAFEVSMEEGDERVAFEASNKECDEKVAFEVSMQEDVEKVVNALPEYEGDDFVTDQAPINEDDEYVTDQAQIHDGDERVTHIGAIHQGDNYMANQLQILEGDEQVTLEVSISEGNLKVLHDLPKKEYDDYVRDEAPIHEGDEYMTDQAQIHDGDDYVTDQAQIHEGDEYMTDQVKKNKGDVYVTVQREIHEGDEYMTDQAPIHEGDEYMTDQAQIQEGDEYMTDQGQRHDGDDYVTDQAQIHEGDEYMTDQGQLHEGDDSITDQSQLHEGDDYMNDQVQLHEGDNDITDQGQLHGSDKYMTDQGKIHEGDDYMTDQGQLPEGDDYMTDQGQLHKGDDYMSDRCKIHEGDEYMTDQAQLHEGDDYMTDQAPILEDADYMTDRGKILEDDDYMTDQAPIHEGDDYMTYQAPILEDDDYMTDQAPILEDDDYMTDQAPIHDGDEIVTHTIRKHQGDNYEADQTQRLEGDEEVTFEVSIPEGNVQVTHDLPILGGDDCVTHQAPIQEVNDMVDILPSDRDLGLNLSENDYVSDADHQMETANVPEVPHSNATLIAERYLESSHSLPNNGTATVEPDVQRVDHVEPNTASGTGVDHLSLDVQSIETNSGSKRENSKTKYTSVLTTTDSEIEGCDNDSVGVEEIEKIGHDDVLLVKHFPLDDSVPKDLDSFDVAIMCDHATESNPILYQCKTISVTFKDEHATIESTVLDEQNVTRFTVLGTEDKEQEATELIVSGKQEATESTVSAKLKAIESTVSGEQESFESTVLGEQEAIEATVIGQQKAIEAIVLDEEAIEFPVSGERETIEATVSDNQEAAESAVLCEQEAFESTVSCEKEAIESTVREENLEPKYALLKDEDRFLYSSPTNEQQTENAEAKHIKLEHQEDPTIAESAMELHASVENFVEHEEKDGNIFLQLSADTDHDNSLDEAGIMKAHNVDVSNTVDAETVNVNFEDGDGAEVSYHLKKHREGDEYVFTPADLGLEHYDVATAAKPFQRDLDPSLNEDGGQETNNIEPISDVDVDVLMISASNVMKRRKDGDEYLYTFSENEVVTELVSDAGSHSFVVVSQCGHEQTDVRDKENEEAVKILDTGARIFRTENQQGIESISGLNEETEENEIVFKSSEHDVKLDEDHLLPDCSSHRNHPKIPSGGAEDGQKIVESELVTLHSSEFAGHKVQYNLKKEKVGDEIIYTVPDNGNWEFGETNSVIHNKEDEASEDLKSNETVTKQEIKKFYYLKMFPHNPGIVEINQDSVAETDGAEERDLNIAAEYHQIQYDFTKGKDTKKYTSTLTTTDGPEVNNFKGVVPNNETESDSINENYKMKYTSALTTTDQYADGHHKYWGEDEEYLKDKTGDAAMVKHFASAGSYIRDVDFIHAVVDNLDNSDLIEYRNLSACQERSDASVAEFGKGNAMDNTGITGTQDEEVIKIVGTETMEIHFTDKHGAKQSYELKKHRDGDEYVYTPADDGLEYGDVDNTGQLTQFDLDLSVDVQGEQETQNVETVSEVGEEVVRISIEDTRGFDVSYDLKKPKDGDNNAFKFSDNEGRELERRSFVVVSESGHEQTCLTEADNDATVDVMDTEGSRRQSEDREGLVGLCGSDRVIEGDEVVFTLPDNENEVFDLKTGGQKSQSSDQENALERRDTVEPPHVYDIEVVAVERVNIHFDTRDGVRVTHELNKEKVGEEYIFTFSNQDGDSRHEDEEHHSQVETDTKSIQQVPEVSSNKKVNAVTSEEMVNFEKYSILCQDEDGFMHSILEKTRINVNAEDEGIPSGHHDDRTVDDTPDVLHDSVEDLIEHDERQWPILLQESENIDHDNCLDENGMVGTPNEDFINSETLDIQIDDRRHVEISYDYIRHTEGDEHAFTPGDHGLGSSDGNITGRSIQSNLEASLNKSYEHETCLVESAGIVSSKQEIVPREESPANDAGKGLIIISETEKERAEILDTYHAGVTDVKLIDNENVQSIEITPNSEKDNDVFAYNLTENEPWGFEVREQDQEIIPDNFAFSSSPMSSLPRTLRRDSDKEDNDKFVISLSDADCKQASNDVFEVYLSDGINSEIIEGNFVGLDANEWKTNAGEDSVGSTDSVESMVYGNDADIEETYSHNETESSLISPCKGEACEINDCNGVISQIENVSNLPIVPVDKGLDDTHNVMGEMQSRTKCFTDDWTTVPDDHASVQQLETRSEDTSSKISRLETEDIQISRPDSHIETQDIDISSHAGHIETQGDMQISSPDGHIETQGDTQISSPDGPTETQEDIQISSPDVHLEIQRDIQIPSPVGDIETREDIQISLPVAHKETHDIVISSPIGHIETQGDIQIPSPVSHTETHEEIVISTPVAHIEIQGDIQISSPIGHLETQGDIQIPLPIDHTKTQGDFQISSPIGHIETHGDIQISSPVGHIETHGDIQISSPICHIETHGDIQISSPVGHTETHGDIVISAPLGHKEKQTEENNISVANCFKEALAEIPMSAPMTYENAEIQVEDTYVINDVTYNVRCPSDSGPNENTTDTDNDTNSEASAFSVDYAREAESERLGASNVFKLSSSLSGPNMQQRFFNADETQRLVQNAANRIPDKEALSKDSFASSFNQDLVLKNNTDFAESKNTETDFGETERTSECDMSSCQDPLSGEEQGESGLQNSSVNEVDSYRPALRKKSDHFVQEEEKQCTAEDRDTIEQTQKNNGLSPKERTVSLELTVTDEDMDSSRESQGLATHRDGKEKISVSIETLISESLLNSREEDSTEGSDSIGHDELCRIEKKSGNVVTCGGVDVTRGEDLSKQREEDNQLARGHLKGRIESERHYAWKVMSPITYKEINIGCIDNVPSDTDDVQNIMVLGVNTDSHDSLQDLSHSLSQVKTEVTEASILSAQEEIHIPRAACKWDGSSIPKDGIEHSEVETSVLTMRQPVSDMDRLGEAISHFPASPQCRQIASDMGDGRNVEKDDEMGAHTEQVYMEELEMSDRLNMYRDTVREVKSELSPARYISDKDEDTIPLVKESKDGRRRVKKGAMAKQSQNLIDICSDSTVLTKVSDRPQLQKTRSADECALLKSEDGGEEEGPEECYNLRTTKSTPVPQSGIRRIKLIDVKEFPKDMPCIYRPYEVKDPKPPAPSASETNLSRPNKPISFRHRPSEARRPKKTSLWKRLKSILKAPRLVHRDGKFRFVRKYKKPPNSEMSAPSAYMSSTASDSLLDQCQDASKSKQRGSKVKIDERFNFRPVTAENGSEWQMESPTKPLHRKKSSKRNEWRQFRRLRVLRHSAETMGPILPPMRTQNVSNKNYVRMLSENYQRAQESKYRHGCEEEARTKRSKKRRSKSRSSKRVRSPLLEHPKDDLAAKRCEMVNSATPEVFEVFCHEDEDACTVKEEPTVRMLLPVIKPSASSTSDPDSPHVADTPATKCHPCAHMHEMSHIHQDMYKKQSTFWRWRCVVM